MTDKLREAAQRALDLLIEDDRNADRCICILEAALAKQTVKESLTVAEPVGEEYMNPTDKFEQIKDIKRLNPVELEAMVLHHDQQIKDLAAHLLELKQLVTPMMEFKRREWVGLTDEEIWQEWSSPKDSAIDFARAIEAKLREKNGG